MSSIDLANVMRIVKARDDDEEKFCEDFGDSRLSTANP